MRKCVAKDVNYRDLLFCSLLVQLSSFFLNLLGVFLSQIKVKFSDSLSLLKLNSGNWIIDTNLNCTVEDIGGKQRLIEIEKESEEQTLGQTNPWQRFQCE